MTGGHRFLSTVPVWVSISLYSFKSESVCKHLEGPIRPAARVARRAGQSSLASLSDEVGSWLLYRR